MRRSISTLRRLKTFMISSIGEQRLKTLALLNVHRDVKLDVDKVIDSPSNIPDKCCYIVDIFNSDSADDFTSVVTIEDLHSLHLTLLHFNISRISTMNMFQDVFH